MFYDNWVARDINGTALENAPFEVVFHHPLSNERWQRHLPIQVQSCWNGIAILDPMPFYTPPAVKFRMANILDEECSASECSLICNDYWQAGFGRIMMVPRVKLAYDNVGDLFLHLSIKLTLCAESLPDHPSGKEEPDRHPGLCQVRWTAGQSPNGSSGPGVVRPSRSVVHRRGE